MRLYVLALSAFLAPAPLAAATVLDLARSEPRFASFVALLDAAQLNVPSGPLTIFAPVDEAFEEDIGTEDEAEKRRIAMRHIVVEGAYPADGLPQEMIALSGETLIVALTPGGTTVRPRGALPGSAARILTGEISSGGTILHPIDAVLAVASSNERDEVLGSSSEAGGEAPNGGEADASIAGLDTLPTDEVREGVEVDDGALVGPAGGGRSEEVKAPPVVYAEPRVQPSVRSLGDAASEPTEPQSSRTPTAANMSSPSEKDEANGASGPPSGRTAIGAREVIGRDAVASDGVTIGEVSDVVISVEDSTVAGFVIERAGSGIDRPNAVIDIPAADVRIDPSNGTVRIARPSSELRHEQAER